MSLTESLTPDRLRGADATGIAYVVLGLRCDAPLAAPARYAVGGVEEVLIGRGPGGVTSEAGGGRTRVLVTVDDPSVSTRHARLTAQAEPGTWRFEDLGSKNGSAIAGGSVTAPVTVRTPVVLELGRTFVTLITGPQVGPAERPLPLPRGLRTMDPAFELAIARIEAHLAADAPVLLLGETGVGKELIARGLHARLGRPGELVAINCGALPSHLVESELFGHRKGAFSGALADRIGYVQAAHGGTLFLDEVGDLPLPAQAALLRVLQEREVTPVGATRPIPVDLRIISATHRDLGLMARTGHFRADLLARLAGSELLVPPLRERVADLGPLCGGILAELAGERAASLRIRRDAVRALYDHIWPANVRELVGALRAALALCGADPIGVEHLPTSVVRSPGAPVRDGRGDDGDDGEAGAAAGADDGGEPLSDRRRAELVRLLEEHAGNVAAVARAMGRHRSAVFRWMRELGLHAARFRR